MEVSRTIAPRRIGGSKLGDWGRTGRKPPVIEPYRQDRPKTADPGQSRMGSGIVRPGAARGLDGKEGVRGSSPLVGFGPEDSFAASLRQDSLAARAAAVAPNTPAAATVPGFDFDGRRSPSATSVAIRSTASEAAQAASQARGERPEAALASAPTERTRSRAPSPRTAIVVPASSATSPSQGRAVRSGATSSATA
jgi:hypothetical protein